MKWFRLGLLAGLLLFVVAAGAAYWTTDSSMEEIISEAQAKHPHPGDNVSALSALVKSQDHTFAQRNRAVWALGRLADPMALLVFEKYYDGRPCEHEKRLCQYELARAINRCLDNLPGEHKRVSTDAASYACKQ